MTLLAASEHITADRIFTDMHTAYRFTSEPVTDADLARVYELAKYTPTALNSQPLRVTFVRTAQAKERLLPLIAEGNRAKSASAPVVAILAADTDFHEHLPLVAPQHPGVRERFAANADQRHAMAVNNAWLQAGGFILAARAAGLDAGPMGGVDLAGIDREFFLSPQSAAHLRSGGSAGLSVVDARLGRSTRQRTERRQPATMSTRSSSPAKSSMVREARKLPEVFF